MKMKTQYAKPYGIQLNPLTGKFRSVNISLYIFLKVLNNLNFHLKILKIEEKPQNKKKEGTHKD